MKFKVLLLASASLGACNAPDEAEPAIGATSAASTYDGADYDNDAAKLAHGARMAKVLGCQNCHGDDLQGGNVTEIAPELGHIYAPNLSLLMADYTDAQLAEAIKHGKPKDGRAMIFMPSEMYRLLADEDYDALVAHLRTVEPGGEPMPPAEPSEALFEAAKAWGILPGEDGRPYYADMRAADLADAYAKGRYIAETACTECHKANLTGLDGFSPDLSIAGTYSKDDFAKMLASGVGKTKDDLGYMTWAAKARFANFTKDEVGALYEYLVARGETMPAE